MHSKNAMVNAQKDIYWETLNIRLTLLKTKHFPISLRNK